MTKNKKKIQERFVAWFTVSRVIVTFWNGIIFFYHLLWIGIAPWTSFTLQSTALITEYFVSGWYEKILIWSNKKINTKTMLVPSRVLKRIIIKYIIFTLIFISIYVSTYYLRLGILYITDFGINISQLERSAYNMVWFTLVAAPIMAIIVIERKKRTRYHKFKPEKA